MEIIADTNILVRAIVADDTKQAAAAQKVLLTASIVAISPIALCEFYWVLSRIYKVADSDIEKAILILINATNVRTDKVAVESGLLFMNSGGDFSDGVLWHLGTSLGGKTFTSFDKKAINILKAHKFSAQLLS
ncbi:MAG: type II toxin-antitoxin system VapC family toxin [Alcaligenaceae bacterium]|jgi:predicted nucleic-acid-binding protein|nr:type II toxin-antitoxin system VapC family toxin [Alcaligenaceae bacterium]